MKLAACLLLLSIAAPAPAGTSTPATREDPPPFECPVCGSDPIVHVRRISVLAYLHGRVAEAWVGRLLGR